MIDQFGPEDHVMRCGRMMSGSKIAPEGQDCVWNANLVTKEQGKIWYGDINLTTEGKYVADLAEELGETIYVLHGHDCRFTTEEKPDLSKAVEIFPHKEYPTGGILSKIKRILMGERT